MARKASAKTGPRYPIESVDNALQLLGLVGDTGWVSVSAAAQHLDVAPSTAHRLLAMLEHHRLIEKDVPTSTYNPGPWLLELGLAALGDLDVSSVSRPILERLVEDVGETAHLCALRGTDVVFLDCVECSFTVRATERTGQRLPAHCTAGGKAMLATLSRTRVLELYSSPRLEGLTSHSTRTRAALLRELERVQSDGFATNQRESEPDVYAVAAAVTDRHGTLRGALTVAGPPERMKPGRLKAIGAVVVDAAATIRPLLPIPE